MPFLNSDSPSSPVRNRRAAIGLPLAVFFYPFSTLKGGM